VDNLKPNPIWPVDLAAVRLWPMEGEDGPLLQELFDDLSDFRIAFGEPGSADAVGTFLNLPEGVGYESKLLIGIWKNGGLAGALDCITGYPSSNEWTVGLLVIADRYRLLGIGSSVLGWLEAEAVARGSSTIRGLVRRTNVAGIGFAQRCGYALKDIPDQPDHQLASKSGLSGSFS
jgi:GNAT superfamily N-acetyltransferase